MMDDLKERLSGLWTLLKDRTQESSIYNEIKDKFENLTPAKQKASLLGAAVFFIFALLYFPLSSLQTSSESISEFENKRDLLRELLRVTKEVSEGPQIPQAPSANEVRNMIDQQIKSANLLPEQIKSIDVTEVSSKLIPRTLTQGGVHVQLSKLNLRQIVSLGSQLQGLNPSVKMKDLSIEANREDNRYFDMIMTFVSLKVPEISQPVFENEIKKKPTGRGSRGNDTTKIKDDE